MTDPEILASMVGPPTDPADLPKRSRATILPSAKKDWRTPQRVVDSVLEFYQGPPDLDPAGHPEQVMPARRIVLLPEDGLAVEWRGKVYVNPPYGRGLAAWVERGRAAQAADPRGTEVLMLLPAATGARYFQDICLESARAICFWRGRIRFHEAPASAAFNSAMVYFGYDPWRFEQVFSKHGFVWRSDVLWVGRD